MYLSIAVARPLQGELTYAVPALLASSVRVGHVVLVPLGRRGSETGYVVDVHETTDLDPARVKPIERLLDPEPAFDARQLAFFRWLANYYLAPLGMVIQTALPSQIRARVLTVLDPTDAGVDALTGETAEGPDLQVLREVISRPGLTRRGLARRLSGEIDSDDVRRAVARLVRKEWVAWADRELREMRAVIPTVELAVDRTRALELMPRAGKRMVAIVESLAASGPVDLRQLVSEQGASSRASIDRLVEAGVLTRSDREDRDALVEAPALGARVAPVLNPHQQVALDAITAPGAAGAFMLWGVTGSGKTEVFLGAASHALASGQQALILVPEIGLTPQLVGRFRARFGEGEVAVLHSGLTGHDRLAQWRRLRAGDARVAVGTRSALFAPFRDLGLIVVDEEHDDSYKQDEGVTYSARDMAVVLGRTVACPVVLASATPSLETWRNAEQGRYTALVLPERATARPVPLVEVVDLTEVDRPEGTPPPLFAPVSIQALRDAFTEGGKAIVLFNRRGYASMVQCTSCGGTYACPNCGITMTLHLRARVVACHYCGLRRPYDGECPACHSHTLTDIGVGTQQVEEALGNLFPGIPRARMDADTTSVRGSHHRILQAFRDGETRLLVGTQIVAKGHDFPDVHTVVVVSADHGFRMPDFRAAERTFALLVQMAGRAGRGERPGRVLVQTWSQDHYVLEHLDDPAGFYEVELRLRATLRYPPFSRLALLRLDGVDRTAVAQRARQLADALRTQRVRGVEVLGPAPAALAKLVGRWRFQIVLRGLDGVVFRHWLRARDPEIRDAARKGIRVHLDVDPRHLM